MSMPLIIGSVWVVCATFVALLPMKHQYAPGIILLILAPVLICWIGYEHGAVIAVVGLFAFVSMFRHPLIYLFRRMRGQRPDVPE